jgi:hypothetical protein
MKNIEQLLQSSEVAPRLGFQEELWTVMAKNYPTAQSYQIQFITFWKQLLAGSVIAFGLSLFVTGQIVTQRQVSTKLHNFDTELSSMQQDILNDPVINEALQITQ